MEQKIKAEIRKNNMKLYPIYEMFGLDFMFYYAIELLFFTQIKELPVANVVLLDSFYAIFSIISQFIVIFIINKIGKKRGLLLGNVLNLIQLLLIVFGNNFVIFIFAKAISAIGFGLKNVTETTFLNSTIPETKRKGEIFTKIDGKGYAKYSYFKSITTLISGFLFEVNPYIPMFLCTLCLVITIIIARNFKEVEEPEIKQNNEQVKVSKNMKQNFLFIFKSKRLRALLSMIAMIWALLCVQSTYNTAILKDIGVSAGMIGLIRALMELIKGVYSAKANDFNKKYSNTLLTRIALTICVAMIIWGIITLLPIDYRIQALIIIVSSTFIYILKGVYQIIKKRYMSNFMKANTLTQIYSVNSIIDNLVRMLVSYITSVILNFMNIRYASLFMGIILAIFVFMISLYMKSRIGLSPEHYDKTDVEI